MNRKELLKNWNQGRVDNFLKAERLGNITEVPGGWLIEGRFYEKFPFKGKVLDSFLVMLTNYGYIPG